MAHPIYDALRTRPGGIELLRGSYLVDTGEPLVTDYPSLTPAQEAALLPMLDEEEPGSSDALSFAEVFTPEVREEARRMFEAERQRLNQELKDRTPKQDTQVSTPRRLGRLVMIIRNRL